MLCPKCGTQIEEGKVICSHCGWESKENIAQLLFLKPKRAKKGFKLGLISFVIWILIFVIIPGDFWISVPLTAVIILIQLISIPSIILSIKDLVAIHKKRVDKSGRKYAIAGLCLGGFSAYLLFNITVLFIISVTVGLPEETRSFVSKAKGEQNMLATGLEAYYIEHNTYPMADEPRTREPKSYVNDGTYASDGGIIPKILTTPIAYLSALPHDPFKLKGKGYYGFSSGPGPVNLIGTDNGKYLSEGGKPVLGTKGWIITSYGPDKVDGNSGIKFGSILREEAEWTDNIDTTQPLATKGLTYDPTNGTLSPGDVWRRGP
jgi:hypothetical protein